MRFKHMGWLRLSLAEAETEKTPQSLRYPSFNDEAKSAGLLDTCYVIMNHCISPD